MNQNDLKKGEIYFSENYANKPNNNFILQYNNSNSNWFIPDITNNHSVRRFNSGEFVSTQITRLATPEERHWLNECIKADKYITKDEALKSNNNLIHGKYKINDIVVSLSTVTEARLVGDMYKVLSESSEPYLYYLLNCFSSQSDQWRLATDEEVKAYNNGITNITKIPPTVESLLIVGKWYKNNDSVGYIAKLAPPEKNLNFPSNEYIYNNMYEKLKYTGTFGVKWLTNSIEVPLSEIQQYLPDGHMDKIRVDKEVIPEYVKCITNHINVGYLYDKIYKVSSSNGDVIGEENKNWYGNINGKTTSKFKPSTKEAYDVQNTPKELIVKWSVGTYIVFIKDYGCSIIGNIDIIVKGKRENTIVCEKERTTTTDLDYVKWFATLEEATNFSKTLNIVDKSQNVIIPKDFGTFKIIGDPVTDYDKSLSKFELHYWTATSEHKVHPNKSDDLEFQTPVILKSKKSKNKLIIINQ